MLPSDARTLRNAHIAVTPSGVAQHLPQLKAQPIIKAPVTIPSSLSCCALQVLGDKFVHYGRAGTGPRHIDPELLLNEPAIDPYIPFESRMRPMEGL